MKLSALVIGYLLLVSVPGARAAELPVKDIPGTIEKMRKMERDERLHFVTEIEKAHLEERDPAILRNLFEAGLAMRKLGKELGLKVEGDYDYSEMLDLLDLACAGLAIHGTKNHADMLRYYKETNKAEARFRILKTWNARVEALENIPLLTELMDFAVEARKFSEEVEKADAREYIPNEAKDMLQNASARLLLLNPSYEGIYEINFERTAGAALGGLPETARMIIVNTRTESKICTAFIDDGQQGIHYFDFITTTVERGGGVLHGQVSLRAEVASEFELKVDQGTRALSGWIRDSRSAGFIPVTGRQLRTPALYYRDSAPPAEVKAEKVPGIYRGAIAGPSGHRIPGTLVIKRVIGDKGGYIAGFESKYHEEFKLGDFNERLAVLNLVAVGPKGQFVRWVLAYRNGDDGRAAWRGFGYSTRTGAVFTLTFDKTGEITDPPKVP